MKAIRHLGSFRQEGEQQSSRLIKSWRMASHIHSTTAFSVIWNLISWSPVMMFGANSITVNGKAYQSFEAAFSANPFSAAILFFPIIGLVMMYHCLAMWVNQTEIKLKNGFLVSSRGPLPWLPKEIKIPVSDIKQAYVQEYSPYTQDKTPVIHYRLMVQRISSGDTILENGICTYSDALMLEQWLETNLGIQDVSIPGEVKSDKKAA